MPARVRSDSRGCHWENAQARRLSWQKRIGEKTENLRRQILLPKNRYRTATVFKELDARGKSPCKERVLVFWKLFVLWNVFVKWGANFVVY